MISDALHDLLHAHLGKVWGKYAGKVEKNDDEDQIGRLLVSCEAVLGSEKVWARPCVPYAGPNVGFYMIPPEGAGVWIEFEGGDVSRAIWTGCYWIQGDTPAEATGADTKVIVTDAAKLTIDDQSGEVVVKNNSGSAITWNDDVKTEAAQATHTVGADGVVSESSSGKVAVGPSGVTLNDGAFSVT